MLQFDSLKEKVIFITGASRGIGRSIAEALGQLGATIIGTATTDNGAEKISSYLAENKIRGCGMKLDVRSPEEIEATIAAIKKQYGAIQVLINNAAVNRDNLIMRMKDEEWLDVMETNLNAIFRLSKMCIRDMLKARWGRIINIGSVVGTIGNPGQVNYAAAKAGILGLSKALALEVGSRNITVNTIAPGFIVTDMTDSLNDEQREMLFQRIPMQRLGTVHDIAAAATFLASDAASYITGQTLHVNGGMYMN